MGSLSIIFWPLISTFVGILRWTHYSFRSGVLGEVCWGAYKINPVLFETWLNLFFFVGFIIGIKKHYSKDTRKFYYEANALISVWWSTCCIWKPWHLYQGLGCWNRILQACPHGTSIINIRYYYYYTSNRYSVSQKKLKNI